MCEATPRHRATCALERARAAAAVDVGDRIVAATADADRQGGRDRPGTCAARAPSALSASYANASPAVVGKVWGHGCRSGAGAPLGGLAWPLRRRQRRRVLALRVGGSSLREHMGVSGSPMARARRVRPPSRLGPLLGRHPPRRRGESSGRACVCPGASASASLEFRPGKYIRCTPSEVEEGARLRRRGVATPRCAARRGPRDADVRIQHGQVELRGEGVPQASALATPWHVLCDKEGDAARGIASAPVRCRWRPCAACASPALSRAADHGVAAADRRRHCPWGRRSLWISSSPETPEPRGAVQGPCRAPWWGACLDESSGPIFGRHPQNTLSGGRPSGSDASPLSAEKASTPKALFNCRYVRR